MFKLVIESLRQLLNDLDSGNSKITEEQQEQILDLLAEINRQELSKTEAANYIGVSVSTFQNYVKRQLIPEGIKRQGRTGKLWLKRDLDNYLKLKK